MAAVVSPVDQLYEYGGVPPSGVAVAVPSHAPLHEAAPPTMLTVNAGGSVRTMESTAVHPTPSVTVTI